VQLSVLCDYWNVAVELDFHLLGFFHVGIITSRHHSSVYVLASADFSALGGVVLTLGSFFSSLLILLLLDGVLTLCEFSSNASSVSDGTLHPGVANDVCKTWASCRVELEQVSDEIHELFCEEALGFVVLVLLPEQVGPVSGEKLVVGVLRVS